MSAMDGLAGRIREELADLERIVSRAEALAAKARQSGGNDYLDGVALSLHRCYTAVGHIFEAIARELDASVPSGPDWHRDLVVQMSAELPGIRTPVIRSETRHCLDEYRGFRHIVRNVYSFNLRPSRVTELLDGWPTCHAAVTHDLEEFCTFLDRLTAPADLG
jgi:hypothetical protein